MTYDQWKTRVPDYWEDDPCDHDDYETDILVGTATCTNCGYRWVQTDEEIAAEHQRMADWEAYIEREERKQRIRDWIVWGRKFFQRRKPPPADISDDLPF